MAPGANNLLALTNGLRYGVVPSLAAVGGRLAAFVAMIAVAALGLGAVLAASELAFQVIKWAGVGYLVYLGLRALLAPVPPVQQDDAGETALQLPLAHLARREFWVAVGNPKAILIFTAVFPQFLVASEPALPQFVMMGVSFLVTECAAGFAYVLFGRCFAPLLRRRSGLVNRLTGGLLLGAAGMLASVSRRG